MWIWFNWLIPFYYRMKKNSTSVVILGLHASTRAGAWIQKWVGAGIDLLQCRLLDRSLHNLKKIIFFFWWKKGSTCSNGKQLWIDLITCVPHIQSLTIWCSFPDLVMIFWIWMIQRWAILVLFHTWSRGNATKIPKGKFYYYWYFHSVFLTL